MELQGGFAHAPVAIMNPKFQVLGSSATAPGAPLPDAKMSELVPRNTDEKIAHCAGLVRPVSIQNRLGSFDEVDADEPKVLMFVLLLKLGDVRRKNAEQPQKLARINALYTQGESTSANLSNKELLNAYLWCRQLVE